MPKSALIVIVLPASLQSPNGRARRKSGCGSLPCEFPGSTSQGPGPTSQGPGLDLCLIPIPWMLWASRASSSGRFLQQAAPRPPDAKSPAAICGFAAGKAPRAAAPTMDMPLCPPAIWPRPLGTVSLGIVDAATVSTRQSASRHSSARGAAPDRPTNSEATAPIIRQRRWRCTARALEYPRSRRVRIEDNARLAPRSTCVCGLRPGGGDEAKLAPPTIHGCNEQWLGNCFTDKPLPTIHPFFSGAYEPCRYGLAGVLASP